MRKLDEENENGGFDSDPNTTFSAMEEGAKTTASPRETGLDNDKLPLSSYSLPAYGKKSQTRRQLVSLDVFRGLTVALMIIVEDAGGIFPAINHSPWNGLTLADVVMPYFLFIVGVSVAIVYKKPKHKLLATRKVVLRTLKLLGLGLLLQGGFIHRLNDLSYGVDINQFRWMGVLQRIAMAYLLAALCEIWLKGEGDVSSGLSMLRKYQFQLFLACVLTIVYLALLYGLYVPDWEYQILSEGSSAAPTTFSVKCGVRGDTGPACNAVGLIDRKILGIQHLYKRPVYGRTEQCSTKSPNYGPLPRDAPSWCQAPFDPEGLLSTMMAIVTSFIGLHYGHIIVHYKDHKDRVTRWIFSASGLVLVGIILKLIGRYVRA